MEQADSDTRRAVALVIFQRIRLYQLATDFFCSQFGLFGRFFWLAAESFQHHDKFIPTQSGDGIPFAHSILQPMRHLDQQQITHGMAKRVIDRLEVIQVQHQQGPMLAATHAGCHRLLQAIEQ
jgi:hypothetical protein